MIKVIAKVFDVLEMLSEDPAKPRALSEIAARLKFHPATCANIMKALVARNYVEQVAPKKGYLLGPAAYRLVSRGGYRQDLVAAAKPHLAALAQTVNETVVLAVQRNGQRFILCQIDGSQIVQISNELLFQNRLYATATGRILLTGLCQAELDNVVMRQGLPGSEWPDVRSVKDLKRSLAIIAKQGWSCASLSGDAVGVAFPVRQPNGNIAAAVGVFLPSYRFKGVHKRKIMSGLREATRAIEQELAGK